LKPLYLPQIVGFLGSDKGIGAWVGTGKGGEAKGKTVDRIGFRRTGENINRLPRVKYVTTKRVDQRENGTGYSTAKGRGSDPGRKLNQQVLLKLVGDFAIVL